MYALKLANNLNVPVTGGTWTTTTTTTRKRRRKKDADQTDQDTDTDETDRTHCLDLSADILCDADGWQAHMGIY